MTNYWLHPALILIVGALLLPLMRGAIRRPYLLIVPILTFISVLGLDDGVHGVVQFLDWQLIFGRVDNLSRVFAYIMSLMCIIGTLFGLNNEDDGHHIAAWFYVAGSIGTILCGDFIVLFLFWEMMAFGSVFLVWQRRGPQSLATGYRYLIIHTIGGLFLLAGFTLRYYNTGGDLSFVPLAVDAPNLATYLILIGFIVNAAVPPFHSWLPDAYAEASVAGAVFMCAFTTKTAIYVLARGFAGMDILIPLGAVMALYGVVYGIIENDGRRIFAWDTVSQVGYMVVGVGIGTSLSINGSCAHAFAHILYNGLLFMGTGSVLYMTGTCKLTELGGLYKKMPITFLFTLIGGLSIAGFPLFSGFVSKSMIITGGMEVHQYWASFALILASGGTFLLAVLKVPYYTWFGKNNCSKEVWEKAGDPPWNMKAAMGIAAGLCAFIGIYTPYLYNMLPFPVEYHPYTAYHLSETMQIIGMAGIAFFILRPFIAPKATISLDLDWFYRMFGRGFMWFDSRIIQTIDSWVAEIYRVIGLWPLMTISRFWSWFDWHAIDGVVDGTARSVRAIGGTVRRLQSGNIQYSIFYAATIAVGFVLVIVFY
ncbi:MAG: Na(+)/H(+) antiporter subunit D [Desulfobulbaceae bacterium]|nr:Na(+)/H(+) antiporter subunit D [Desulfobulbaceae bacterium]